MSIIWDRIEGDILPRPNGNSSPEPWISSWNIQTELTLPCKEESITVLNAIGQKESIPVKDHKATITLIRSSCYYLRHGCLSDTASRRCTDRRRESLRQRERYTNKSQSSKGSIVHQS